MWTTAVQSDRRPGERCGDDVCTTSPLINFQFSFSVLRFRVFKKSSSNGKITVYLGKRDFVDHITHVDPIGELIWSLWPLKAHLLTESAHLSPP